MRPDFDAWLDRANRRHDGELDVAEYVSGRPFLFWRNQVLVAGQDVSRVETAARRWLAGAVEPAGPGPVARVRLDPAKRVDVTDLLLSLRSGPHRSIAASLNHVLQGEPQYGGGPADFPAVPDREDIPAAPRAVPYAAPKGRPVTVAVLDTGIAPHAWFEDRPWWADCADLGDPVDLDGDDLLDSQAGHGTFIAGLLTQQIPQAHLVVRRVLSSDGIGSEAELVAILWELAKRAEAGRPVDVVNISLGGYTWDDRPSPVVADAVTALSRWSAVVCCAGNRGSDRPFWPAALKRAVAVGALDSDGSDRAPFSNYGWWVDACAVGERVTSAFIEHDGPLPSTGDHDADHFTGYATWSGTSFAAPVVAGRIAARCAQGESVRDATDAVIDPAQRSMPDLGVIVGGRDDG